MPQGRPRIYLKEQRCSGRGNAARLNGRSTKADTHRSPPDSSCNEWLPARGVARGCSPSSRPLARFKAGYLPACLGLRKVRFLAQSRPIAASLTKRDGRMQKSSLQKATSGNKKARACNFNSQPNPWSKCGQRTTEEEAFCEASEVPISETVGGCFGK